MIFFLDLYCVYMANRIKKIPKIEQPREKIIRYGSKKLLDHELLAVILRVGIKNKGVLELSQEVWNFLISNNFSVSYSDLKKIKGLGTTKICQILSVLELVNRINESNEIYINNPSDIFLHMADLKHEKKEHFVVFYLDTRSKLIKREIISIGNLNSTIVHPREVFEPAIKLLANSIILSHNHPSNSVEPSSADIEITLRIQKSGEILGINLLDHVIVSKNNFFSMKQNKIF